MISIPTVALAQDEPDVPASRRTETIADDDPPEWRNAIAASLRLLAMQHAARMAQPKTRAEPGGPFFKNYQRSAAPWHRDGRPNR